MDKRTAIIYGVTGQTLEVYPPEGTPSAAATYSIWKGSQGDDQTALLTGTATADTLSLTLDASSGYSQANRRKVSVSATTGATVGRLYRLTNVDGQSEIIRISRVVSADYVETDADLAYDYSTSATFKGYRQTISVDNTFAATEGNLNIAEHPYRVLWSYAVSSVACRHWTYFDLVRSAWQHGVTRHDLADYWSDAGYADSQGDFARFLERVVDAAGTRVQIDLRQRRVDPNEVLEGPIRDELVRGMALLIMARQGRTPPGRDAEAWRRDVAAQYIRDLEGCLSSQSLTRSTDRTGAITAAPSVSLWFGED